MDKRLFLDTVSIPAARSGRFEIKHAVMPAGHVFTTATLRSAIMGGQRPVEFAYDKPTTWHELHEHGGSEDRGGLWMTDVPCEQAQMRELLRPLHGKLLIGGLGLGLASNLACWMPRITEITVVEQSADVIALVEPHLRKNGKIVNVRNAEVGRWLKNSKKGAYDCALLDTWASDGIGTLYREVIPLLDLCSKAGIINVSCWQEDVMRGQLRMQMVPYLTKKFLALQGNSAAEAALGLAQMLDKRNLPTQKESATGESFSFRYDFPVAVCCDNAYPSSMEEVHQIAESFARDFGVPGWTRHWKVDRLLWKRWLTEASGAEA